MNLVYPNVNPLLETNFESSDPSETFDGNEVDINDKNGISLTGFDVESLYPSIRDIDAACLVRESVIHSDIVFDGFDYRTALCYLRIMAGHEIMSSSGLKRLIPKWGGGQS